MTFKYGLINVNLVVTSFMSLGGRIWFERTRRNTSMNCVGPSKNKSLILKKRSKIAVKIFPSIPAGGPSSCRSGYLLILTIFEFLKTET